MPIITLTTDFGNDSPYVAAMKGVILSIDSAATLVDITHSVPAQDVRAGAVALADSCRWFPRGTIHVAVVDPGVGTARKLLCLVARDQIFVGPDNGVLSVAAGDDAETRAFEVSDARYRLTPVSNTFHGRDIMAPTAAHLGRGIAPEQLGPPLDEWRRLVLPAPVQTGNGVEGEILLIDSFGNLITNVTADLLFGDSADVSDVSRDFVIELGSLRIRRLVRTYGNAEPNTAVALIGSSGRLELAVVNGNAASEWHVGLGQRVTVRRNPSPASR